nr:nephrin-like [Cherax quadricarinatus]
MRNGPATHWKNPDHLGLRATFEAARNALNIQRVQTVDEGTYRCRVDFRINPTLTFTCNLSVVVPPSRLLVYTEMGEDVRTVVGPYSEGDTITINCRAIGGSPLPRVTWWEGAVLLDMTSEEETSEHVTNTLLVPSLTRGDLHRPLTCQASNTNLTKPLEFTVTINMNFPPLWVRILGDRAPLSAGRPYDLQCQVVGARPPAVVTWRLQNTVLNSHTDKPSSLEAE